VSDADSVPNLKRARLDDDPEELQIYGDVVAIATVEQMKVSKYSFEVRST